MLDPLCVLPAIETKGTPSVLANEMALAIVPSRLPAANVAKQAVEAAAVATTESPHAIQRGGPRAKPTSGMAETTAAAVQTAPVVATKAAVTRVHKAARPPVVQILKSGPTFVMRRQG